MGKPKDPEVNPSFSNNFSNSIVKTEKFILAITGPTGAGKSTVSDKLAKLIRQCVNIDADHVKHFIVNGFAYDKTPEGTKQWELLGENAGLLARNFLEAEYNVIINGYINEPAWNRIQKHVTLTHKIVLLPRVATVIKRDSSRNEELKMGNAAVSEHHTYFSSSSFYNDFERIDSTNLTVEETVNKLLAILH